MKPLGNHHIINKTIKMKKQNIAAITIGIASMMGVTAPVAQPNATTQQTNQKISEQQKPVENKQLETMIKSESLGGMSFKALDDYGIPPKIYGLFHVKVRTHKRTNKNK